MRRLLLCLGCTLAGFGLVAACSKSSNNPNPDGGTQQPDSGMPQPDSGMPQPDGGMPQPDGGMPQPDGGMPDGSTPDGGMPDAGQVCDPDASTSSYVLIDDMETTMNGPIQFMTGIADPLTPGYWYNSGASYTGDDGGVADMSNPPQMSFTFTALAAQTKTLGCSKTSDHAAHQSCTLNGLYDTCGIGFEFAQKPDPDADGGTMMDPDAGNMGDPDAGMSGDGGPGDAGDGGPDDAGTASDAGPSDAGPSDAGMDDAGDGGPPIPRVTVPFDISHYKAVTFWGMTTTPDPMTGTLPVKMSFPDTDTDPRGDVCNGGGANTSKCYNSYAATFGFTTTWQQFTVNLDAGDGGAAPVGGIAIDPTWGYQGAQWLPAQVYGINWQAQRNIGPTDGPPLAVDFWIDDVFFVQ
jgi:hypothetical protein